MDNKSNLSRFVILYTIMGVLIFFIVGRLFALQFLGYDEYNTIAESRMVKSIPQKAPRGEILDRYGRPLVSNRMGYTIRMSKLTQSDEELNDLLLSLIHICEEEGAAYIDTLPVTKEAPFKYKYLGSAEEINKQTEDYCISLGFDKALSAEKLIDELCVKYGISEDYSIETRRKIAGVRAEMDNRSFSAQNSYDFASDVNMNVVTKIKESYNIFKGVNIITDYVRTYNYPSLASHILGRTGQIYKEEYDKLREKGYSMTDLIGKDGIEQVCENELRGIDGTTNIEQDENGHIISTSPGIQAIPGKDVVLTIDLELQKTAEESLEQMISQIRGSTVPGEGGDCQSGSIVVTDIHTGEILAMASYPTYSLQTFNEDYQTNYHNENKPMWNRAISGIYEPGSTFKMITALAALEEGIIDTDTTIYCSGRYEYYAPGYRPYCSVHSGHGSLNVISAIEKSCNVFFFDIGRQLTIDKLNEYVKKFGLGQLTGIEIQGEAEGIIASPEYRKKIGTEWYPGDTIQAAIGQSDNLFTPLQLCNYVATLANGGTRYQPHLIKKIKEYSSSKIINEKTPKVEDTITTTPKNYEAVMQGMKSVTEDGTASQTFREFDISVGGKTGTAEVSKGSPNAVFVAFAPYEAPQIAISIIVEHGGHGNVVAPVARDIISKYFKGDFLEYVEDETQMYINR